VPRERSRPRPPPRRRTPAKKPPAAHVPRQCTHLLSVHNHTLLKGLPMTYEPGLPQARAPECDSGKPEEMDPEVLASIPNGTIYSYNLDDRKTPGGLKVRWKIRVATGPEAGRWDARQADAIKELLTWATQRRREHPR
jgi:hypothetical protein